MEQERTKRVYDLHAWTGVVCGLFIYVVSLSGVFALFGDELRTWEEQETRIAVARETAPVMPLLSAFVAETTKKGRLLDLSLNLPTGPEPFYLATALVKTADGPVITEEQRWHPNAGTVLPLRAKGLSYWIVDFHRNLMLDRTLGRFLVALSGIVLLVLIVSGLVMHRKIFQEIFTWRLSRSIRLKWQDSHKTIAVWGLPCHLMFAFTGAWLGLVIIFVPITAMISFKGDTGALIEAVLGPQPQPTGISARMFSIDEARDRAYRHVGIRPDSVSISLWGDEKAKYRFRYPPSRALISHAWIDISATTGRIIDARLTDKPGLTFRVNPAMTTLHYGQFGGLWIKFLYVVLGISLCLITATGLMIWLERRLQGSDARVFIRALSRTTVGVCAGMGLASFAIFFADKLLPDSAQNRISVIGITYFGVWAAAVLYALLRRNEYRTCKELFAATAVLAAGLPALNYIVTGDHVLSLLRAGHGYAAGVDIAGIATGIVLLLASIWIPADRLTRYADCKPVAAKRP